MKIYGIDNSEILDVKIASSARHEEEMMKSDFVRLSWKGNVKQTLPVGAYIVPFADGLKYRLIEPYTPQQDAEDTFTYQPEFQHPLMWLGKVPFTYATKNTLGEDVVQQEWEYTGLTSTLLQYAADFINTAFDFTAESDKFSPSMTGDVDTNVSVSFSSTDVLSALTAIANACSANKCEWHLSWKYRKLYFGQVSVNYAETVPTLKVGVNVGKASVSGGGDGYYNVFFPQGSTRNMSAKAASGENVSTGIRLGLDKTKYPDGMIDTRTNANEPKQTLALTFDDVYPHVDCYAYNVRQRTRYLLDDNNEKVVSSYNPDGSVKEYKKYTVWYMRLAYPVTSEISGKTKVATTTETVGGKTRTLYWYDYVVEDSQILDGYTLCGSFSANTNEGALASSLVAQPSGSDGFELRFHKAAETIPANEATGDSGVSVLAGDFEIVFVNQDNTIIPTNESEGLIPRGESEPSTKCNIVILYNIAMGDEEVAAAQDELEQKTKVEIAYRQSDLNNYTFNAYPQVWAKSNPKLYIGQRVVYDDGNGYSYTTRMMKLVTNIDYDIVQEITVGNAAVKGTVSQLKEDVQTIMSGNWSGGGGLNTNEVLAVVRNYSTPRFLSKLNADTAQGVITFLKGLRLGDGSRGIDEKGVAELAQVVANELMSEGYDTATGDDLLSGRGFHCYTDASGRAHVVTDFLSARMKAYFNELDIRKVSYSGGNDFRSAAGDDIVLVEEVEDFNGNGKGWKCWFVADDGDTRVENLWRAGDQAMCRTFNITAGVHTGVSNKYYWRLVVGCGVEEKNFGGETRTMGYVVLSGRDDNPTVLYGDAAADGSREELRPWDYDADTKPNAVFYPRDTTSADVPAAGDAIVQVGSQADKGRMKAMESVVTQVNGEAAPALAFFSGISNYSLTPTFTISPDGITGEVKMYDITITNGAGEPVSLTNWRGGWSSGDTYSYGDEVSYGGAVYIWNDSSSQAGPADVPGTAAGWSRVASQGADGASVRRNLLRNATFRELGTVKDSAGNVAFRMGDHAGYCHQQASLYGGTDGACVSVPATETGGHYSGFFFVAPVEAGKTYTASVMAYGANSLSGACLFETYCNDGTGANGRKTKDDAGNPLVFAGDPAAYDAGSSWTRHTRTFTVPDNNSYGFVELNFWVGGEEGSGTGFGDLHICQPKLEEGGTATAFCLNEADLKGDTGAQGEKGEKGEKGDDGKNGNYIAVYYGISGHATAGSDGYPADLGQLFAQGTSDANDGWKATLPDATAAAPYQWAASVVMNGSTGKPAYAPVYWRVNPKDGGTVKMQYRYYCYDDTTVTGDYIKGGYLDVSSTHAYPYTSGGWQDTPPSLGGAPASATGDWYLWCKITQETDGGTTVSAVCMSGRKGEDGAAAVTYEVDPVEESAEVSITEAGDTSDNITVSGTLAVSCQYKVYRKTGGVRESGALSGVTISKAVFDNDTTTTDGASTGLAIDNTNLKVTGTGIGYTSSDTRKAIVTTLSYGGSTIGVRTVPVTFAPASMIQADQSRWTQIYANKHDISAIRQQAGGISLKVDRIDTPAKNLLAMSSVGTMELRGGYTKTLAGTVALEAGKTYTVTWQGRVSLGTSTQQPYQRVNVYCEGTGESHLSIGGSDGTDNKVVCGSTTAEVLRYKFAVSTGGDFHVSFYLCDSDGSKLSSYNGEGSLLDWLRVDEGDWTSEDALGLLTEWEPADADLEAVNLLPDHLLATDITKAVDEANVGTREKVGDGSNLAVATDTDGGVPYIRLTRSGYTGTGSLYGGVKWYVPFRGAGDYTLSASLKDMRPSSLTPDSDNMIYVHLRPCDAERKIITNHAQFNLAAGSSTGYGWEHAESDSGHLHFDDEMEATASGELTAGTKYKVAWLQVHLFMHGNGDMAASRLCLSKCSHATLWNAQELSGERKDEARQLATGIDIYQRKVRFTGDTFEWRDNSGNAIAEFTDDGATFHGNVSAETFSTNDGGMSVGTDGVLHAKGAELEGTVSTSDGNRRATLSGGGMQVADSSGNIVTEHTGETHDTLASLLPATGQSNPAVSTDEATAGTATVQAGTATATTDVASVTPSASGTLEISVSRVSAYASNVSGDERADIAGPRLDVALKLNGVVRRSWSYEYADYSGMDGTPVLEAQGFAVTVNAIAGATYKLTLEVTVSSRAGGLDIPAVNGYASCVLSGASFGTSDYHSLFFGNGILLSKGNGDYLAAMTEGGKMRFETVSGGKYGLRCDSTGVYHTKDGGTNWRAAGEDFVSANSSTVLGDYFTGTVLASGGVSVTLPAKVYAGERITIIHNGTGAVLIYPNGHPLVTNGTSHGTSAAKSSNNGNFNFLYCAGSSWYIKQATENPSF